MQPDTLPNTICNNAGGFFLENGNVGVESMDQLW